MKTASRAGIFLIKLYQTTISPLLGPAKCRFIPTCSEYASEAVERYGLLYGSYLALRRLLRCGPWCHGGYDPVPGPDGNEKDTDRQLLFFSQDFERLGEFFGIDRAGASNLLLEILEFFYKLSGSYGLAIVLLTVAVRLLLYPLNQKQLVSMQQMQKIQPRLKMIQEKYANNKEKMNQETMLLYKEYKVNPAAGCLPLLVQLPILILLFNVLRAYKGFEGASFCGILLGSSVTTGLAQAIGLAAPSSGTYGIMAVLSGILANPAGLANVHFYLGNLVILIGISVLTWAQQALSGTGNNPQMAMMNTIMPIFMAFICLSMPGGVMLYWGLSSLIGVVQQYFVMKKTKVEMQVKPKLHKNKPAQQADEDEDDESDDDDDDEEEDK